MPSHRLLLRAGYVRQLGSGIYSLLPLGLRVNRRVEQIIREEQDRIGGQEMEMPVVHPADVWRASGRYDAIGPELTRFKDRGGRDMVLAMTHEEVVGHPAVRHRPLVSPAPDAGLSLPDQVARRAALAGRADPRPRVRHEGRLQLRSRRRRARRQLSGPVRRVRPDVRAVRARGGRGVVRCRDHGRHRRPRVHGAQPGRRGRPGAVRVVRIRRQPPGRGRPEARGDRRGATAPAKRSPRPARPRSRRSPRSSASTPAGPRRRRSSRPATAAW